MKHTYSIAMLLVLLPTVVAGAQPVLEPERVGELKDRLFQAVKPTPDQEVQIEQIIQTHQQAVENWHRQNDEKLQTARRYQQDALQADDRGTLQAVTKELRQLMESRRELFQAMLNQIQDVLDKTQFAQVREILQPDDTGSEVLRMLQNLRLKDSQKAEVQSILDQAAVRARTKQDPTDRQEIMDAAVETIRQTVLSQAQRDALETLLRRAKKQEQRRAMLAKMDFTEEQKARIQAILAEARKRAAKADSPQQKQAILAEARKIIRRDVWTQKQRDQFFLTLVEQHHRQMRSIGMSEDQIARAEKILDDARAKAQAAQSEEIKQQILHDAFETIRQTVLRPDQRERWK